MNAMERVSWEKVRAQGRARFLLRSIVRAVLGCGIGLVLIRATILLFANRPLEPVWELLATWAFISVGTGAAVGLWHWDKHEKAYHEIDGNAEDR